MENYRWESIGGKLKVGREELKSAGRRPALCGFKLGYIFSYTLIKRTDFIYGHFDLRGDLFEGFVYFDF